MGGRASTVDLKKGELEPFGLQSATTLRNLSVPLLIKAPDGCVVLFHSPRSAILIHHDGSSEHYEVLWKSNGDGWARPVAFMDRHGNAIEIEYVKNQPSGTVQYVGNYFKKSIIRDAYGREADFSYIKPGDRPLISLIGLPNGSHISYEYGSLPGLGNNMVTKVTHPDGSQSTWSTEHVPQPNLTRVIINRTL